jgi:hypothetical protein
MNKQEAIEKIKNDNSLQGGLVEKSRAIYCIEQIQEPKKVVVPNFVAEWIEECKSEGVYLCTAMSNDKSKTFYWLDTKEKQDIFARAWLDGYTVEKEKLYTVETPNPNTHAHTVLQKTEKGIVLISVTNARWRGWESSKLTESEIKEDFEWAFQFAKPVEEK